MAMNITHQIGALAGTPISTEPITTTTSESTATVSATAAWKTPMPNMLCRTRKPDVVEQKSQPTSPCRSPILNGIRADLSVACRAFALEATTLETATEGAEERMYREVSAKEKGRGVPVYVMMPLDSVTMGNTVNRRKAMNASLQALKSAGVEGIMVDVWWGLVERDAPGVYNWGGYTELLEMAKRHELKVQAVMSFHRCGGNVGDSCTVVVMDVEYTRQCLFNVVMFHGALDFGPNTLGNSSGNGSSRELRYPSYPEQNGTWKFPGIGAFQCYDKYMLSSLKAAAEAAGKPEWGSTGPTDAGRYNNWPEDTQFFRKENGGWTSPYGEFFLNWYSQMLLDHGERILSSADAIFENTSVKISVKVAGIHWHYGTRSHAPELTAGYYNTRFRDGYLPIAQMLGRHGAIFNFTCIEMRDHEQPQDALCAPEKLVRQVALATQGAKVPLAGENALPRYDEYAHEQILQAASLNIDGNSGDGEMCAFTYLRMSPHLFQEDNWRRFVAFVKKMKEGKNAERCREQVEREAEHFVHMTQPLVQQAAMALMH
ncbi:hypothetical protein GH714_022121 [Hevea brasiliensis]|uniref:Beta-amylase n=1 Tax=Hevea brasiliensis TaxID=3981 RepID=A0A6A6MK15_HEVBR|nr:hypothetical protein GH714_022121 [Hevea brasiliensis]